jgi:multicomponent Na+:H+ antiporter subunit E
VWGLQVFGVLVVIWFGLDGWDRPVAGGLAAAAGALLAGALATERPHVLRPHRVIGFFAFFVTESFRGGVDVAWRALRPAMPIAPAFLRLEHRLPPGQPRTLMVSALSLLPGTLSVGLADDGRTLIAHVLFADAAASMERLQARIRWLYGLPDEPP